MVGWIKMPLGTEVGRRYGGSLRPRPHCLRWQRSFPPKKAQQPTPTSRPISIVTKWLDGSGYHLVQRSSTSESSDFMGLYKLVFNFNFIFRPPPRRHCVRWGPSSPPRKGAQQPPPIFSPCLLWPNGHPSQQLLSSC